MNAAINPNETTLLSIFSRRRSAGEGTARISLVSAMAVGITLGLFTVMQSLVASGDLKLDTTEYLTINWAIEDIPVNPPKPIDRNPIEKLEPVPKPETIADPIPTDGEGFTGIPVGTGNEPTVNLPGDGGITLTMGDGGLVPLVVVQPDYPRRAQERGIEGYVIVQVTVGVDGSVLPGSAQVIESSHKNLFDKSALKAVNRFKYKPLIVDGKAQETSGVTYKFSFELDT